MAYIRPGRYDSGIMDVDLSTHILKAPYKSVTFPRSEKVQVADVVHERYDDPNSMAENFNVIPNGVNPMVSISYGRGPYNDANKKVANNVKGSMGQEPRFTPEGGWQYNIENPRLSDDYYSELRRHVDPGSINLDPIVEHLDDFAISHPEHVLHAKLLMSVQPDKVYEINAAPEVHLTARPRVYKVQRFNSGVSPQEGGPVDQPNPLQIEKYIQAKHMINVLTPIFTTFIKVGDATIPIKFRDPIALMKQAELELPIQVPMPDGSVISLKDYHITLVQNINSPTEMIFEVPVQLKDRPDIRTFVTAIESNYKITNHQDAKEMEGRKATTFGQAPLVNTDYDSMVAFGVPELFPSHVYNSVMNGVEAKQKVLDPTQVTLRSKPLLHVQPMPTSTYLFSM